MNAAQHFAAMRAPCTLGHGGDARASDDGGRAPSHRWPLARRIASRVVGHGSIDTMPGAARLRTVCIRQKRDAAAGMAGNAA